MQRLQMNESASATAGCWSQLEGCLDGPIVILIFWLRVTGALCIITAQGFFSPSPDDVLPSLIYTGPHAHPGYLAESSREGLLLPVSVVKLLFSFSAYSKSLPLGL